MDYCEDPTRSCEHLNFIANLTFDAEKNKASLQKKVYTKLHWLVSQ